MSKECVPSYIAVEGIPRAGKTTQALALVNHLRRTCPERNVYSVIQQNPLQSEIVKVLHTYADDIDERAEALLRTAALIAAVQSSVLPVVAHGGLVIRDESVYGALACIGYGSEFNGFLTRGLVPGLIFFLDISAEESMRRAEGLNVVEDVEYLNRVRKSFLQIADQEPKIFKVIDGSGSVDEITARMLVELTHE